MVRYTKNLSYFDGQCGCASCHPDWPLNIVVHQPAWHQKATSEVKGLQPGEKWKWQHRAGKRMPKVRKKQLEELEWEARILEQELEEFGRQLEELDKSKE